MNKLHIITHYTVLATTPSLFAYPQPQSSKATIKKESWWYDWFWGEEDQAHEWTCPTTYDEIIQMLDDLESGELEMKYTPQQLCRVNEYIAYLAKEGILPNEEEIDLDEDVNELLNGEDSACELAQYLDASYNYTIIPTVFNGYFGYDVIQCGKVSKAWKKTKKFVKKHKKEIIIGAAVVVAVAAITVAIVVASSGAAASAAAGAVGAAGTAVAGTESSPSELPPQTSSNDISNFKAAIGEEISTFKENLADENFFQSSNPGESLTLEETGRIVGSVFAHDSFNHLSNKITDYPQFSQEMQGMVVHTDFSLPAENPMSFGHDEIDWRFSSNCTPMFSGPAQEVGFNALSYQVRGERALDYGYYLQAVNDLGKAIEMNSTSPIPYLDRSEAHFRLGNYDKSIEDFRMFTLQTAQEYKQYPMNIPDFSIGFLKGLPKGILESGNNILLLCSDIILRPIQTGEQIWGSLKLLNELARSNEWDIFAEVLAPEVHHLVTQWDTIPCDERGELAGHAFGKYGADIIIPGALAKAVARGMRGAREISAISSSLKTAKKTFLMESVAGMESGEKIAQIVQIERKISEWLGEGARFIKNEAGDPVFLSKDGLRCVRFDFNRTTPHHNPHAHLEMKIDNKWVKSGQIYPTDVPHN